MDKTELLWIFAKYNKNDVYDRTIEALRQENYKEAAHYARLDHERLLRHMRKIGRRTPREEPLPVEYMDEIKAAIRAIDSKYLKQAPSRPATSPAPPSVAKPKPGRPNQFRQAALKRAGYQCKSCGIPEHAVGFRDNSGRFHPAKGSDEFDAAGKGLSWPSGKRLDIAQAKEIANKLNTTIIGQTKCDEQGRHWIVVRLTAVPLDGGKPATSPDNLTVLCRQCGWK